MKRKLFIKTFEDKRITAADVNELYKLEKTLINDPTPVYTKDQLTKCLVTGFPIVFSLYEKKNGKLNFVGYSLLRKNNADWDFASVAVYKKYRRFGFARILANLAIIHAHLHSNKTRKMIGHSGYLNKPMHNLFKSMGFKKTKTLKKFYGEVDAFEFERKIEPVGLKKIRG